MLYYRENYIKGISMQTEKLSYFNGNITIDADLCNGKPQLLEDRELLFKL